MAEPTIPIQWADGSSSLAKAGEPWLEAARRAKQVIPTACRSGSCGACDIEVNGIVVRACISRVPSVRDRELQVTLTSDPFW